MIATAGPKGSSSTAAQQHSSVAVPGWPACLHTPPPPLLPLLLPLQSLVADLFVATQRGRAFGVLYLTGALGGMAGALYATNLGGHRPLGMEGWRFAFLSLAAVSAAAGVANLLLTEDPQRAQQQQLLRQRQWQQQLGEQAQGEEGKEVAPAAGAAAAGAHARSPQAPAGWRQPVTAALPAGPDHSVAAAETEPLRPNTSAALSVTPAHQPKPQQLSLPLPAAPLQQLKGVLREVGSVVRIPTFLIIVLQARLRPLAAQACSLIELRLAASLPPRTAADPLATAVGVFAGHCWQHSLVCIGILDPLLPAVRHERRAGLWTDGYFHWRWVAGWEAAGRLGVSVAG